MTARPDKIELPSIAALRRTGRMFARAPLALDSAADGNTLRIFGEIGHDVTANAVADKLNAASGNDVTIKINSPGGSVDDGLAIFNMLAGYPGRVDIEILSVAASAASLIAMAGDHVAIAPNAFLMIHKVWGATVGNAEDHAKQADTLRRFDSSLAKTYAKRTNLSAVKIEAMMSSETWMQGNEAVALGFADGLLNGANASAQPVFNLAGVYQNVPAQLTTSPASSRVNNIISSRADLEKQLREKLGLAHGAARKIAASGFAGLASTDDSTASDNLSSRIAEAIAEIRINQGRCL